MSSVLPAQRLHGWSWLFHAARVLKEVALPLLILVLLKREEILLSLGLAGTAAALACAYGWLRARSVRYELLAEEIVIREGLFAQELRHVPFGRIQSVSERRGLLHRALGVTELVLESGSGGRPEAVMRVLDSRSAAQLAESLRLHRAGRAEPAPAVAAGPVAAAGGPGAGAAAAAGSAPTVLLAVPTAELVKLGLISNRGFLVVAAVVGVLSQNTELLQRVPGADRLAESLGARINQVAGIGMAELLAGLLALLVLAAVAVRVLSVGHALVTQHGYTLTRGGDRLRVQRGLLTRTDVSGRVGAIERLVLERTLLHRLFGRCTLRVDLPASVVAAAGAVPRLDHLAPIASVEQADALIRTCLPGVDLQALAWRPLHPGAAWRRWQRTLRWLLPLLAAGTLLAWGLPGLPADAGPVVLGLSAVLLGASAWHARRWAAGAAYAQGPGVLVWRSGVFTRRWVLLPEGRCQAVLLRRSPADRRAGTARLCTDAQSVGLVLALDIPWLAEADALALRGRLWRASAVLSPRAPSPESQPTAAARRPAPP